MANRHTLHISHLPKLKMWLEDQGWELQPLTDHGYEVLRARRDKKVDMPFGIAPKEYQKAINRGYNVSEADIEKLTEDYKRVGKL